MHYSVSIMFSFIPVVGQEPIQAPGLRPGLIIGLQCSIATCTCKESCDEKTKCTTETTLQGCQHVCWV